MRHRLRYVRNAVDGNGTFFQEDIYQAGNTIKRRGYLKIS